MTIVSIERLRFNYPGKPNLLNIAQIDIPKGQHTFVHGPSGSGKSTLLSLMTGISAPASGIISILGTELGRLSPAERDAFRGRHIGYIFQQFNLLPYLDVWENTLLPLSLGARGKGRPRSEITHHASQLLEALGLTSLKHQAAGELSIGQAQRVAAARALLGGPELIIADEPTSALDADNRQAFIELIFNQAQQSGSTVVLVSHDRSLKQLFASSIDLREINQPC